MLNFDLVDLHNWKKKRDLITEFELLGIRVDEREIRNQISRFNREFEDGCRDDYICHSARGYKRTTDPIEIMDSVTELERRSVDMFKKAHRVREQLKRNRTERMEL